MLGGIAVNEDINMLKTEESIEVYTDNELYTLYNEMNINLDSDTPLDSNIEVMVDDNYTDLF